MSTPILQVNQVTKTFGGIFALDEVSFDLYEGCLLYTSDAADECVNV